MPSNESKTEAAAQRVVELEEELEASGVAALDEHRLSALKAILHRWIDGMHGVVISPALGRVTLIDEHGGKASIASSQLAFSLSAAGARTIA